LYDCLSNLLAYTVFSHIALSELTRRDVDSGMHFIE